MFIQDIIPVQTLIIFPILYYDVKATDYTISDVDIPLESLYGLRSGPLSWINDDIEENDKLQTDIDRPRVCYLPRRAGNCNGRMTRYYYDHKSNNCKRFTYRGCSGNENNFATRAKCKNICEIEDADNNDQFYEKMIIKGEVMGKSQAINWAINHLPFELHIPGYKYCGPGTKSMERKPINQLDGHCREHDLAYRSNDLSDRHKADLILIERARARAKAKGAKTGEKIAARLIYRIMLQKVKIDATFGIKI